MSRLEEINKRLKRTNIKGKDYVEVNQRILAFWELFPGGAIETEKLADDGKRCDFIARISMYDTNTEEWRVVATGHAFEYQGAGMVNKTSYVENAETSAVGRALGMLGIGATESIASAEEVMSAIDHQERGEEPHITPDPLKAAQAALVEAEIIYCDANGIDDWKAFHSESVMTRSDYENQPDILRSIAQELLDAS